MPQDMLDRLYSGSQPTGAGGGTQQPAGSGDMLDRVYGNRQPGIMNAQLKPNEFQDMKSHSLIYGVPAYLKGHGHETAGGIVEGGLDALAGLGSGVLNTASGLVHMGTRYASPDSFLGKVDDYARRGMAVADQVKNASTPAAVGQGVEQTGEYFMPLPGTKKLEALSAGKGIIKRALITGTKDAYQVGGIVHAQTGGDFSRSVPAAMGGGVIGGAVGAAGATYDRIASLTQDYDPARIAAADFARREGATWVDPATRTGSPAIKNTKKFLSSGIGAPDAEALTREQNQGYADIGQRLQDRVNPGGVALDKDLAGGHAYEALEQRRASLHGVADARYDAVRQAEANAPVQQLQVTRYQMQPSGQVNAMGMPISTPARVQVTLPFHMPVDRSSVQAALKPLVARFMRTLTVTEQDASPGLLILKNIVNGDSIVEASEAIEDLRAIFQRSRLNPGDLSRNLSQGLAAQALAEYRAATDQAISSTGMLGTLNQGRAASGMEHATGDLMRRLGGNVRGATGYAPSTLNPVMVYNNLVRQGDQAVASLQQFAASMPGEVPMVAQATVRGLLEAASGEGAGLSFSNAGTALRKWNALGPRTKDVLFGAQMTADLTDFFRLGKYLSENPNPSNTGIHVAMAARLVNLLHNPMFAIKDFAVEYALGKYLFSNGGALPYIQQMKNGAFGGVNPAIASVAAAYRQFTGIDPETFVARPRPGRMPVFGGQAAPAQR